MPSLSTSQQGLIPCDNCHGMFSPPPLWHWNSGKHPFVCGEKCRKDRRRITRKKYKSSDKGIASERRWRLNPKKKEIDKKARMSPFAKQKAVARVDLQKQRHYALWVKEQNRLSMLRWRFKKSTGIKYKPWRDWWFENFNKGCAFCTKKEPEVKLCIDHKKPRCQGGDDSLENLQILCRSCNGMKGYGKERTSQLWKK